MLSIKKDYEVSAEGYKGPFHLLFELVLRNEISAQDLTIRDLVYFFMTLEEWENSDGQFDWMSCSPKLLLCASLLYKKSCALLEIPEEKQEEILYENVEDDFRAYREYLEFKEHATNLNRLYDHSGESMPAYIASQIPDYKYTEPDLFSLDHLVGIFDELMESFEESDVEIIPEEEFRVSDKIQFIENAIRNKSLSLKQLIFSANTRIECIVIFLALLELVKQSGVNIEVVGNDYMVSRRLIDE